jgi:uncharacterized membrane protein YfcA
MDTHTLTLLLGIVLAAAGAYMMNKEHFKSNWKPEGLSAKMEPERAKRLIRFQALVIVIIGIDLTVFGLTGHDLIVQMLATVHL